MIRVNPQYERDIAEFLGEWIRDNKKEDGTTESRVYECNVCEGLGGEDWSTDCEVYDDWHECMICNGTGEIEIE